MTARVFIDGKEAGYSPLVFWRLRAGKHVVRVVEDIDGKLGRAKSTEVHITGANTRKNPLRLVVQLGKG
jgi:hypothetical protein